MYTVILKRGNLPDMVRKDKDQLSALARVSSLLCLHSIDGYQQNGTTFIVDASSYYRRNAK